jgi:HD superfamily phosphohydrolase
MERTKNQIIDQHEEILVQEDFEKKQRKINRWREKWPVILEELEQSAQEFEDLLEEFTLFENGSMSRSLQEEEIYLKAKDMAANIAGGKKRIERIKQRIREEDLENEFYEIIERIKNIEESFQSPGLRVQQICTKKGVKKSIAKNNTGIEVSRRLKHSSYRGSSPHIKGRMKSSGV